MTEHNFVGLVYDMNTMLLTGKMYVYGFKRDNVPTDYKPIFQTNKLESTNNKGSIYSGPFYSFINESKRSDDVNNDNDDDVDFSKSNSQLDNYALSTWIFCVFVRLMCTNVWI